MSIQIQPKRDAKHAVKAHTQGARTGWELSAVLPLPPKEKGDKKQRTSGSPKAQFSSLPLPPEKREKHKETNRSPKAQFSSRRGLLVYLPVPPPQKMRETQNRWTSPQCSSLCLASLIASASKAEVYKLKKLARSLQSVSLNGRRRGF